MATFDDAVTAVRAAFEPGADPATRQQAAAALRSLLAVLEATPGAPLTGATVPDFLGAIIEKLKPHMPADAKLDVPRLDIPMVPIRRP